MARSIQRTPANRETQRINLSFNPKASFPIRKYQSNEELVTFLNKLWQQISESSNTAIPLGSRPNISLKIKRDELAVHDVVLAAFSDNCPKWSRLLIVTAPNKPNMIDLDIHAPMLTPEALRKVVQFLYEGKSSFTMTMLPQLLDVAKFFGIWEIRQKCGDHVLRFVEANPSSLLSCLQISYSHDLPAEVKEKLVSETAAAFTKYLSYNKGECLLNLSGDVVEALLSSDNLDAPEPIESTIFEFVTVWLKRNRRDAPKYVNSLINACRFDHMTTREKFKCFGDARASGIDHLIRKSIMDADWKKTCNERNPQKKCDNRSPKRGRDLSDKIAKTAAVEEESQEVFQGKKTAESIVERRKKIQPKELSDNIQQQSRLQPLFTPPLNASPNQIVVEIFSKMLNKKGRRLLQNRLMDPNFTVKFRDAINNYSAAPNRNEDLSDSDPITERNFCPGSVSRSPSGFLYSPESNQYKAYLDACRKSSGSVVAKHENRGVKAFNGGKPLKLRQSIIHTKLNRITGLQEKTAYELKIYPYKLKKIVEL